MSDKPTIILLPGAWHGSDAWEKVSRLLEVQHYNCVSVDLPSTGGSISTTFGEDVAAVRESILAEINQGRDVVLVAHSYGGAVGQSSIKGLTRLHKDLPSTADNQTGHVIGLIMVATGFIQTGISFIENVGGKPPPSWKADPSGFAVITVPSRELFYHDLSEEEGNHWVSKLKKQSLKSMFEGGEDSYAGWMDVPVWFLATSEDKAFPFEAQKMFVQSSKEAGADITLREIDSSHSPMLSRPEETVEFMLEALASFVGH